MHVPPEPVVRVLCTFSICKKAILPLRRNLAGAARQAQHCRENWSVSHPRNAHRCARNLWINIPPSDRALISAIGGVCRSRLRRELAGPAIPFPGNKDGAAAGWPTHGCSRAGSRQERQTHQRERRPSSAGEALACCCPHWCWRLGHSKVLMRR